jgi:uncharacterized protein YceH (UPF0502 family)
MSTELPETPPPSAPHQWQPLSSRQRRVFGVLIEKAKTTPDGYPMTLNAIVAGANQKSNREPQMNLSADDVQQVLEELRGLGCVTEVQGSGRVPKFRHHAYEWLGVEKTELAVMTELLLRGEQTLGELRGRASRMEPIADLAALKPVVEGLVAKGLMIELTSAGRGQVVSHNLYTERELSELKAQFSGAGARAAREEPDDTPSAVAATWSTAAPRTAETRARPSGVTADEFAELSVEVAELRAEVARLRETVGNLEAKLQSLTS